MLNIHDPANPQSNLAMDGWNQLAITLDQSQIMRLLTILKHAVLLDSGTEADRGSYDILSGEPLTIMRIDREMPTAKMLLPEQVNRQLSLAIPEPYRLLPFVTGQIGLFSYDFGAAQIIQQTNKLQNSSTPSAFIGYYPWSYVFSRKSKQGFITFSPVCPSATRQLILNTILQEKKLEHADSAAESNNHETNLHWQKTISYQEYCRRFEQALAYINAGDCYQVNLAQRFEAPFSGSPLALYMALREGVNTPYSAFMSFGPRQNLLCFSPEQFIRIHDRQITTRPIKGTIPNHADSDNPSILQNSEKNRAENLMIVDLLRNDLSRVCQLHSVKVTELFKLESYQNVHHLVSSVEGELRPEFTELEAFLACFPGGSITGTPKKRAIEIIAELEVSGRDAYCGSLFYWNDDGQFDSNILIRTIVHSDDKLYCWGGGGIVHDSIAEDEYLESLIKVENLTGISS